MDGVFNHCGSFNKWLDAELIYQHDGRIPAGSICIGQKPLPEFFSSLTITEWPFNDSYDGWWGHSIPCRSSIMRNPRNSTGILWILVKMGFAAV